MFCFFALWSAVTFGGLVPKILLADPITMLRSGYDLMVEQNFAYDIVIGLIGLITDLAFKALNRKLFPWARL